MTDQHYEYNPMDSDEWRDIQKDVGILGDSEAIRQLLETIDQVAPTDISVLITGESGTGKELAAKAMHLRSERAQSPPDHRELRRDPGRNIRVRVIWT
ncbi:MAG: sigma 54-interacting transcriptional regulator [candidate division KSB1 bacterium]|nr:sigma 54-interacting transcriptional regulator [candidate division KSB1 bacterium]